MNDQAPGAKLKHIKSDRFISEVADQVNIAALQGNDGTTRVALIFARDVVDLLNETFTINPEDSTQPALAIATDDVQPYRLQLANITLTLAGAKRLVAALEQTFSNIENGSGNT